MQWIFKRRTKGFILPFFLLLLFFSTFTSCSDPKDRPVAHEKKIHQGCASCHTDQDLLKQLAEEEPQGTEDTGEG